MSLLVLAVAVIGLIVLRVPVAFAILIPSLVYVLLDPSASLSVAAQQVAQGTNDFVLLAVPLFIMVGVLANASGATERLFTMVAAMTGRVRGSLGYANVASSFGFAWISGAAVADAAAMGRVMVPAMEKRGYDRRFATGLTASSSLISPILPPSIPAIIYAATAGLSVGAIFAAGILPALVLVGALCLNVAWYSRGKDELRMASVPWRAKAKALGQALLPMGAVVIILGGVLGGFFTPTEAAGVGVAYLVVYGLVTRQFSRARLGYVFRATLETTGSVMLIIASAGLLGWILTRERAASILAEWLVGFIDSPLVFLILVNLMLLVVGAVLEPTAAILILVPVLGPVAVGFGVDPLHFGMVVILNLMLGLLTPPVGLVLFVMSSVTRIPVPDVIRSVLPFFLPLLVVLLLITFVPAISTFVPGLFGF